MQEGLAWLELVYVGKDGAGEITFEAVCCAAWSHIQSLAYGLPAAPDCTALVASRAGTYVDVRADLHCTTIRCPRMWVTQRHGGAGCWCWVMRF